MALAVATVPDDRWLALWTGSPPAAELTVWDGTAAPLVDPSFVVLPYLDPRPTFGWLPRLPSLQVIQLLTAGYEAVLKHLPDGVTLCNAAGVHDHSTAELAVGLAIPARRGLGDFARAQPAGDWLAGTRTSLADSRVLMIGAGSVGGAIARRLAPFDVELTRVASRARDDEHGHVHGPDELPALLPQHDVVILICPLTPATRDLV